MKILITADLHYDIARSRQPTERLAEEICRTQADAVVLVGDTAGADLATLRRCLGLFDKFAGRKLMVLGNHCLWRQGDQTSMDRYERLIPQTAAEAGFEVLDRAPAEIGDVGLAGSIGWYDYSFAEKELQLPEDFYRAKMSPGAAAYLGEHQHLLDRHEGSLQDRHYSMGVRWMDGVHVRLGISDEEFVAMVTQRLRGHLADLSSRVRQIVAFVHHLPFAELVPRGRPDRFAFAAAYMGTHLLGKALLECPKLTHVYCGHSHWPGRSRIGHLSVVNIGSTYVEKRLEVLELPANSR